MKSYILVPLLIILISIGIITYIEIPTADTLTLDKDSKIIAGEGENCITPYTQIECEEGLECMLLSDKPYKNGVCLPKGTKLDEDLINRYSRKNQNS